MPSKKTPKRTSKKPVAATKAPTRPQSTLRKTVQARARGAANWYAQALLDPDQYRGCGVPDMIPIPTHKFQTIIDVPIPRKADGTFSAIVAPDLSHHVLMETGATVNIAASAKTLLGAYSPLHHRCRYLDPDGNVQNPDLFAFPTTAYQDLWNADASWTRFALQSENGTLVSTQHPNSAGNFIRCLPGDFVQFTGSWNNIGGGATALVTGNFRVSFYDAAYAFISTATDAGVTVTGTTAEWLVAAPANTAYIGRIEFQNTYDGGSMRHASVWIVAAGTTMGVAHAVTSVPDLATYREHFDGYRLVGMSALASYVGSVTNEGGLIAAKCFPCVIPGTGNSVDSFDYAGVAQRPGSYRGRLATGAYVYWKPAHNRDFEFESVDSPKRLGESSFLVIAGTMTDPLGAARLRVIANWEAITHSQIFAPSPSPVAPLLIWHALELLAEAPTAFENPLHLARIRELLAKAGMAAARLAWNNRGQIASGLATATGNPELAGPAANFANAIATPKFLR